MNRFFLAWAFLIAQCPLFAQLKPVAESEVFQEAETGWTRLMILKNGYTAYLLLGPDGNEIRLFDERHQPVINKKLKPAFGKPGKDLFVNGIFELNGDLVCFLTTKASKKTYNIYRLVINGKSGDISKEDKLAELERSDWSFFNYSRSYPENYLTHLCIVRKDPESEQYVVGYHYAGENVENGKRMELVTFDAAHKETGRAFLMGPDGKGVRALDLAYRKGEVYALCYANGNGQNGLAIGKMNSGNPEISVSQFPMPGDYVPHKSVFTYNKVADKFVFLAYPEYKVNSQTSRHEIWTGIFDPVSNALVKKEQVKLDDAVNNAKALFGKKATFDGKPVNLVIHDDGSWMVMIEELKSYSRQSMAMQNLTITDVEVNHLLMVQYSKDGQLVRKNFLPKAHLTRYLSTGPHYQHFYKEKAWPLDVGDQFKYSAYLQLKGKGYVFYNDEVKRVQHQKEGKLADHAVVSTRDLHIFQLSEDLIPDGKPVFGEPSGIKHNIAIPGSIVTDATGNKIAMLRIVTGRKNMMQVVWLDI